MTDLLTKVGSLSLANPVMTASGTSGHGAELSAFFDLSSLGAVVVKSVSKDPWAGNPSPRLHPLEGAMLNSVGLQGPGISAWLETYLPELESCGARVVVSIWGRRVGDYAKAAEPFLGPLRPELQHLSQRALRALKFAIKTRTQQQGLT